MTYRRTVLRRLVNAVITIAVNRGLGPRHRYLLTVRGRRSGIPRTTPVGLVEHEDGRAWLVAPYGEMAWVRNARAAGVVDLARGGVRRTCSITPAGPTEAAAVLREYVALEPITRGFFDAREGEGETAFAAEADRHPVFTLRPA